METMIILFREIFLLLGWNYHEMKMAWYNLCQAKIAEYVIVSNSYYDLDSCLSFLN